MPNLSFLNRPYSRSRTNSFPKSYCKNPRLSGGFEILERRELLTDVSGAVSGTWNLAGSPYRLTNNAYVSPGASLSIESGVRVVTNGNSYDLTVNPGGELDASGATFTIDVLNYQNGSMGNLSGNTLNLTKMTLLSAAVTFDSVNPNTFIGTDPVTTNPSLVSRLFPCTFTTATGAATIHINGDAAVGTTTWQPIGAATKYSIDTVMNVPVGSTLTINGAEVSTPAWNNYHGYNLNIYGTVNATNVKFTGYPYLYVYNGGVLNETGCQVIGTPGNNTWTEYQAGSSGTIGGTTYNTAMLRLFSNAVTLDPASADAFIGTDPVTTNPSLVPKFFPFTFTSTTGAATIHINGDAAVGTTTWQPVGPAATKYSIDTVMNVPVGSTLTISGAEVSTPAWNNYHGYNLNIYGTVNATNVKFTGYPYIFVSSNGQLNLNGSQATGIAGSTSVIEYQKGSVGQVLYSKISLPLTIDSESSASIHYNDFSAVNVTSEGNKNKPIDMTENWWGTIDPAVIGSKITDQIDNSASPLIQFQPFLLTLGTIDGTAYDDTIRIVLDGHDPTKVDVFLNNTSSLPTASWSLSSVAQWNISGFAGDDQLTVDFSQGNPLPAGGLVFDGGSNTLGDKLIVVGTPNDDLVTFTGSQIVVSGMPTVSFSNIEFFGFDLGAGYNHLLIYQGKLTTDRNNAISEGTDVTIDGGTLDLNGYSETLGNLELLSGSVLNGNVSASSYQFESGTMAAAITGPGIVTKTGSGSASVGNVNTSTVTVTKGILTAVSIVCDELTVGSSSAAAANVVAAEATNVSAKLTAQAPQAIINVLSTPSITDNSAITSRSIDGPAAMEQPVAAIATPETGLTAPTVSVFSSAEAPQIAPPVMPVVRRTISTSNTVSLAGSLERSEQRTDEPLFTQSLLDELFTWASNADLHFAIRLDSQFAPAFSVGSLMTNRPNDSVEGEIADSLAKAKTKSFAALTGSQDAHSLALQSIVNEFEQTSKANQEDSETLVAGHTHKQQNLADKAVDGFQLRLAGWL